ncbi:MAG TPA: o-succinylbenzoate synthase [Blastocatellia bacterium]|jgi:O-succinylbenzoate synthase|nr:o-succinylbenzoate synthase [Blastocatellia bacterium]
MKLRLEKIELREIGLPLKHPFETSFGRTTRRRILISRVFDASGAFGYGECTAAEDPFYNHETIDTAWTIITGYVAPILGHARVDSASEVGSALHRIRGNRMAKGAIEAAIWDLEARLAGKPLWQYLGGTRAEIDSGVSIGLQETRAALLEKVARELESGYQRIKIKIKPGRDIDLVEAVREKYPKIQLMVDANSAYTLADTDLLAQFDRHNLMMIEQPLTPGDLLDHSKLQGRIATPICLDESILTVADARQAHELGSCRIINIKLGRVGGHNEARLIQQFCLNDRIPVWCGGMLESGIGRAHNIAMSTLEGFSLPGDVSASERYWEEDIIDPPVTVSGRGTIKAPDAPGIGFEVNERRVESLVVRREDVSLK